MFSATFIAKLPEMFAERDVSDREIVESEPISELSDCLKTADSLML